MADARRRPRTGRLVLFLSLSLLLVLAAAGFINQRGRVQALAAENQGLRDQVSSLTRDLEAARAQLETQEVSLYFVRNAPTEFWLVPETRRVQRRPNPLQAALQELIRGPENPLLDSLLPGETRVLGVTVRENIAYPDFSADITRLSVGARGEALALGAIANTLIQFPGVELVQILVEGKTLDSLAGHIDISGPIGRNEASLWLGDPAKAP